MTFSNVFTNLSGCNNVSSNHILASLELRFFALSLTLVDLVLPNCEISRNAWRVENESLSMGSTEFCTPQDSPQTKDG